MSTNLADNTHKNNSFLSTNKQAVTPTIELSITAPDGEPIELLPNSYIRDIFFAYGLSMSDSNADEKIRLLTEISNTKRTFPYLQEIIKSDRYPRTIMLLSSKVGMYIPSRKRIGLSAYNFYLENIKYYEYILDRPFAGFKIPTIYDIFMAKNRVMFLMKHRDDEILRSEYNFPADYENRKDMIEKFITNNILIYGEFTLENNSRTSYSTKAKAKVIVYSDLKTTLRYSISELLNLFDLSKGVVWKNPQGFANPHPDLAFNNLSLLHLRQQILEKFGQWRNRDNAHYIYGSTELYQILTYLENMLINEIRNDAGAYFGSPQLI